MRSRKPHRGKRPLTPTRGWVLRDLTARMALVRFPKSSASVFSGAAKRRNRAGRVQETLQMCLGKSLRDLGLRRGRESVAEAVEKLVELKTMFEISFGIG